MLESVLKYIIMNTMKQYEISNSLYYEFGAFKTQKPELCSRNTKNKLHTCTWHQKYRIIYRIILRQYREESIRLIYKRTEPSKIQIRTYSLEINEYWY